MYLEKLEIQGFKSFASKNILIFPGMINNAKWGITAVVGPNGSGKSNIADAVRWALGEQSMRALRGKKGEDVIFSGSDKKGKLGMAEVSLFLNNEDRQASIDYSQIILTRRLFRSGESEYLINDNRVRLADIQMLLAKANVGQKTYSVIGQGLVEGFLNTTLAERKEFFDEATGVKQYQIKRDDSLNKLRGSYENLTQVNMLLTEIEPRLKSLTRQVNKLSRRSQLEQELKDLQLNYYGKIWHEINEKFNTYNKKFLELEKLKFDKEKKLNLLNNELNRLESQSGKSENYETIQKNLNNFQEEKNSLWSELARINARLEIKLETRGKFDLSWLNRKQEELEQETKANQNEISKLENTVAEKSIIIKTTQNEKNQSDARLEALQRELVGLKETSNRLSDREINNALSEALENIDAAFIESDLGKLRQILKNLKNELKKISNNLSAEEDRGKINELNSQISQIFQENQNLLSKINEHKINLSSFQERLRLLREKLNNDKTELENISHKLNLSQNKNDLSELKERQNKIKEKIFEADAKILELKNELDKINKKEDGERNKLFTIQRNIQSGQYEINSISQELGELKINSTRYETKLEDLEIEIRGNLGSLKEIRNKKLIGPVNLDEALAKISQLKQQLEQIGGIDPEIEKEYIETSERYNFLSEQTNDLQSAIQSLEKIIIELDGNIKEKFDKEFKRIQAKFEEYFKILFNGGNAKIIKVMESENEADASQSENEALKTQASSEKFDLKKIKFLKKHNATGLAGIEIQATPPGKKIKSVSMLSGGERALTAIALICAIISANPSPFVVLDEVDAALDEANSERLAKILDDLSRKTQFIVITHNRASMRKANIIYGVTMGDDGISKLLSIKLEDKSAPSSIIESK